MIHPLSDCKNKNIPESTRIWQFCIVMPNCVIGENCNICAQVLIENDVFIGNNVTIKSGVQVWDGVRIEDDAFIGPNVTFTNDLVPRSKKYNFKSKQTIIRKGASIGANATVVAGNIIGEYSLIGAGSVVTSDIPSNTIWYGNPAKLKGYITNDGIILDLNMCDKNGKKFNFKK